MPTSVANASRGANSTAGSLLTRICKTACRCCVDDYRSIGFGWPAIPQVVSNQSFIFRSQAALTLLIGAARRQAPQARA